jgi:hypothetical protein
MQATTKAIHVSRAEANFRAMTFRIVYNHVFANVSNLTARFAYALAYTARDMKNRELVDAWWQWTRGRGMKGLLESGHHPPPELQPFVESYLRAIGERARQTGDDVADLM